MPAFEEKRLIARGLTAIGVTCGVADGICLGLDDTASHHAFGQFSHDDFSDEKTSELRGINRQLCPIEHARGR